MAPKILRILEKINHHENNMSQELGTSIKIEEKYKNIREEVD